MFRASGVCGRLLAHYATAATLGPWTCVTGETIGRETRVEAAITHANPVLIGFRPLTVGLKFGDHEWRWVLRDEGLQITDTRLHGTSLGAPAVYPLAREDEGG